MGSVAFSDLRRAIAEWLGVGISLRRNLAAGKFCVPGNQWHHFFRLWRGARGNFACRPKPLGTSPRVALENTFGKWERRPGARPCGLGRLPGTRAPNFGLRHNSFIWAGALS